jgi:putative peptidoglycan lipid II flippase
VNAKVAPLPSDAAPRILRTAVLLLPLQIVFRGGEALLPLFLAAWFGRSPETDLYYLLSAYFVFAGAILTGAFQDSGAVSVLVDVGLREPERLPGLAGALLGRTLAIGASVGLAMALLAAVPLGLVSSTRAVALSLVLVMSLGMMATSVRAFYVGLLNARGVFHAHPLGSGFGALATWTLLAVGRHALGVVVIPLALLAGELLAISIFAWIVRRVLGFRVVPSLERSEPIARILALVRLEVVGTLITRINPVLDQLMAGLAAVVGGGTLLRYATDVASLPTSVLQATLFPVLLTRLAHEAARPLAFRSTVKRTLGAVVALSLAVSALLVAFRLPLCRLAFAHGSMDPAGVQRIADILPWALAGVAPFGALLVLARAHVALQNSRIMPSMGALNAALNAILNAVFVGPLGLAGIALSTSLTYVVVALVFWLRLPRFARG